MRVNKPIVRLVGAFLLLILLVTSAIAHNTGVVNDPELLVGWLTWLHLTIQWLHLVSFALWLGLVVGCPLFGLRPSLDRALYASWILLLMFLATGTYNAEWSSGIPESPSLFLLPILKNIPYGVTYTIVLAVKTGIYAIAILLTIVITILHLRFPSEDERWRKVFFVWGTVLALSLTLAASVLLFYHEAADLWPTKIHSQGGVLGPEGPLGQLSPAADAPPPNDFSLLTTSDAWIDIGLRWFHLLGFGLFVGGSAWTVIFGGVSTRRFLVVSWMLLATLILSGVVSMGRWTPFYVEPYIWNLNSLAHLRFGRSYTYWMALKHGIALGIAGVTALATWAYTRRYLPGKVDSFRPETYAASILILGLAVGYVMMIILLIHEGVDHAL